MHARPPLVLQDKTDCVPRAVECVLRGFNVTTPSGEPIPSDAIDVFCRWSWGRAASLTRAARVLDFFGVSARVVVRPMTLAVLRGLQRGPIIASTRRLRVEGRRRVAEAKLDEIRALAAEHRERVLAAERCSDIAPAADALRAHAVVVWRGRFERGRAVADVMCPSYGRATVTVRRLVDSLFKPWVDLDADAWRGGMLEAIEVEAQALEVDVEGRVRRATDWRSLCHVLAVLEHARGLGAPPASTRARVRELLRLEPGAEPVPPSTWHARSSDGPTVHARATHFIEIDPPTPTRPA